MLDPRRHPGPIGVRLSATESAGTDWPRVAAFWARAGELEAVDAVWMSDHLSDSTLERNGPALEVFTTVAALAHHLRGRWAGISVAAATFRHPAIVAKMATVLDHATGGRFVLGMGAGWHAGEHDAFGIPLPPIRERFDRYEASVASVTALVSDAARIAPGVTLDDPTFPLRGATNEPPPRTPGGPPIWLGGTRPRGLALLARFGEGWPMPGNRPGDVAFFADRRDAIRRALEAAGRDPAAFSFAAQLSVGRTAADRRTALEVARRFVAAGATHVILGLPVALAPGGLEDLVREVAEPLRSAFPGTWATRSKEGSMARDGISAPGAAAVGPYSHAVRSGGFVFLSGQTPIDPATGRLADGPIEAQTRQCFANLRVVLAAAGLGFDDVVECHVFLVDMADFGAMNAAYAEHFTAPYPARTTIGVAALPLGARVEIRMVARDR